MQLPAAKKIVLDDGYKYGADYRAILQTVIGAESRDRIEMLYETGMRPTELWKVRGEQIKKLLPDCWLIEYPHDEEKTGTYKRIPLSDRAREIIAARMQQVSTRILFPSQDGGEVKYFRRPFMSALRRTNLRDKGYTVYCMRRTRATIWDAVDSDASRYALGHSPTDSHRRNYVRITDERLFKLVGKSLGDHLIGGHLIYRNEPRRFCVESNPEKGNYLVEFNARGTASASC